MYVTYFKKNELVYVVDRPILWSELTKDGASREEIVKKLLDRCNELGRMDFGEEERATPSEVLEESAQTVDE